MKFLSLRNAIVTAFLALAAGHADFASAHSLSGALGSAPRATDLYQVTCFTEGDGPATDRLRARVRDNAPVKKPLVSVQIYKGSVATNTTDSKKDGDNKYSPWASNNGGSGVYYVMVDKSAKGAERYTLEYHCETNSGSHTGTATSTLQNQ